MSTPQSMQKEQPQGFKVDPENPGNPGSLGHPYGCKPCNKYKPERPDDSCKHSATCSFCHGKEHERPKHGGQRSRHATLKRQFLGSRENLNPELVEIIDEIYKEPHEMMDDIKRQLRKRQENEPQFMPNSPEWDKEVDFVVQKIEKIGEEVQNKRPDNVRVRKARSEQPRESSKVDLGDRCRWYCGTLHLTVQKMWDEQKPEPFKLKEIRQIVTESLREFKALTKGLERRLHPQFLEEQVTIAVGEHEWLWEPLKKLVEKEAQAQSMEVTEIISKEVWKELSSELRHLRKTHAEVGHLVNKTSSVESLEEMFQVVKDQVEKDKLSVLDDAFEDSD